MPKATQIMPTHKKAQKPFATHQPKSPKGVGAAGIKAGNAPGEIGTVKK